MKQLRVLISPRLKNGFHSCSISCYLQFPRYIFHCLSFLWKKRNKRTSSQSRSVRTDPRYACGTGFSLRLPSGAGARLRFGPSHNVFFFIRIPHFSSSYKVARNTKTRSVPAASAPWPDSVDCVCKLFPGTGGYRRARRIPLCPPRLNM